MCSLLEQSVTESSANPNDDPARDLVIEAIRTWRHNDSFDDTSQNQNHKNNSPQKTWLDFAVNLPGGEYLSLTFDRLSIGAFTSRLGNRLLWWPAGQEERRRISVVSSRLGERKDLHRHWFDALRTVAVRCDPQQECLCVVDGTAACEAVSRAAALFGIPLLRLVIDPRQITDPEVLVDWYRASRRQASQEDPLCMQVRISPAFQTSKVSSTIGELSLVDAALVFAGERIIALSCRKGGTVQRLLLHSLQQQSPQPTVLVFDDRDDARTSTRDELSAAGAVPWLLDGYQDDYAATAGDTGRAPATAACPPPSGPLHSPDEWLCHWTRPRRGPWPDESADDFWDALIMGCASADHSAVGALLRIIETRQLLPSELSHGAVSWTAVPLNEFGKRRVYRRHLRRYDFEPWGVAVRRSALLNSGCRPVVYVHPDADDEEENGPAWERQPATDSSGRIDWTTEREWRILGCVDLATFVAEDVFIFANSSAETAVLQSVSPWPVIKVPET
jgi:hypothetical protein